MIIEYILKLKYGWCAKVHELWCCQGIKVKVDLFVFAKKTTKYSKLATVRWKIDFGGTFYNQYNQLINSKMTCLLCYENHEDYISLSSAEGQACEISSVLFTYFRFMFEVKQLTTWVNDQLNSLYQCLDWDNSLIERIPLYYGGWI